MAKEIDREILDGVVVAWLAGQDYVTVADRRITFEPSLVSLLLGPERAQRAPNYDPTPALRERFERRLKYIDKQYGPEVMLIVAAAASVKMFRGELSPYPIALYALRHGFDRQEVVARFYKDLRKGRLLLTHRFAYNDYTDLPTAKNLELQYTPCPDFRLGPLLKILPWVAKLVRDDWATITGQRVVDWTDGLAEKRPKLVKQFFHYAVQLSNLIAFTRWDVMSPTILDWIRATSPSLMGLDYIQAQEEASRWHDAIETKDLGTPALPGKAVYEWPDGWTLHQLTTKKQLKSEGASMAHCVDLAGYYDRVKAGESDIFSLRDPAGVPLVTFEVEEEDVGYTRVEDATHDIGITGFHVYQAYGSQNRLVGLSRGRSADFRRAKKKADLAQLHRSELGDLEEGTTDGWSTRWLDKDLGAGKRLWKTKPEATAAFSEAIDEQFEILIDHLDRTECEHAARAMRALADHYGGTAADGAYERLYSDFTKLEHCSQPTERMRKRVAERKKKRAKKNPKRKSSVRSIVRRALS